MPVSEPLSWWQRYAASVKGSGLTSTATRVLDADSDYLLQRGILGAGAPADGGWNPDRFRSGLVMGAVQSGKTASMLALIAKSMDASVDVVVVLAGTRLALWHQTYERLARQLDFGDGDALFPPPRVMSDRELRSLGPSDIYQVPAARAKRLIARGRPMVFVVMKHGQHLAAASRTLHESVFPHFASRDRPGHVLVIDDEADDGSILDAEVENRLDPQTAMYKQIPRHIVDLWSRRYEAPATVDQHVFATYVAYTATPQANFLQEDVNPLAPRDFVASLRTPGATGSEVPRSSGYKEPSGRRATYTGGEVFYGEIGRTAGLVVPPSKAAGGQLDRTSQIAAAVRAYAVAGAIRIWRDEEKRRPSAVIGKEFASRDELRGSSRPHTACCCTRRPPWMSTSKRPRNSSPGLMA